MKLAIVAPCYNEEAVLETSARKFEELLTRMIGRQQIDDDSFVMFVNDGSRDRTWPIIRALHDANPRFKGLNLAHNVGHQNAIMAGMMTAKELSDAVITIDVDLQDDIEAIPKMVEAYCEGADVVYGVRSSRETDTFFKRFTAQTFYKMQRRMGIEAIYNHADFRLMSRRILDELERYDERNLYLRGIIPQIGMPSATVEYARSERMAGESKYPLKKMFALAIDGITSFSVKPLYAIMYVGVLFLLISLGIGIYVVHALFSHTAVAGWASLMLSIWLVGGFILLAIGAVGLYVGKTYQEVKHRPRYHIERTLL